MTDKEPRYKISVNEYGGFTVEACTKADVIELFDKVSNTKKIMKIGEAVR